jgi:hypothetical protein
MGPQSGRNALASAARRVYSLPLAAMQRQVVGAAVAIGLTAFIAGCTATGGATRATTTDGSLGTRSLGVSTTVLQASDLSAVPTISEAFRARVPNLRIRRSHEGCPLITLRRARRPSETSSPLVYVEATPAVPTA